MGEHHIRIGKKLFFEWGNDVNIPVRWCRFGRWGRGGWWFGVSTHAGFVHYPSDFNLTDKRFVA